MKNIHNDISDSVWTVFVFTDECEVNIYYLSNQSAKNKTFQNLCSSAGGGCFLDSMLFTLVPIYKTTAVHICHHLSIVWRARRTLAQLVLCEYLVDKS